jgi:hypothetical protein
MKSVTNNKRKITLKYIKTMYLSYRNGKEKEKKVYNKTPLNFGF